MKYLKRNLSEIPLEEAHGGTGARQMLLSPHLELSNNWEAVTKGFLRSGNAFDWHNHKDTDEIFIVTAGHGKFLYKENDQEIVQDYEPDDVFIVPANIFHRIEATGQKTTEGFFVRVKAEEGIEHNYKVAKLRIAEVPAESTHDVPDSRKTLVTADVVATNALEAITKGILRPGKVWNWHAHAKTDELSVVLGGAGKYSIEQEEFEYTLGDVVIVPKDLRHRIEAYTHSEFFFIRVRE